VSASVQGDALRVRRLRELGEREIAGLSRVLSDCVTGGASVGFLLPMPESKASAYWRSLAASVARGTRLVLAAEDASGTIVGTVQLLLEQPENQAHRADLAKMLVDRRARRHGIGAALLGAAEREAAAAGKTLLVLDTAAAEAARLYARYGWQRCGAIPGYALWPDGTPCATTVFFKPLTR
jgi:GNAT superfamily N-acetyltransferase